MGKLSRNKGHSFERFVARLLSTIQGVKAKRRLEYQGGSADIDSNLPFEIQCKHGATPPRIDTILDGMKEIEGKYLIAMTKRDYHKPVVGMYLDDWLDIIKEWHERGIL